MLRSKVTFMIVLEQFVYIYFVHVRKSMFSSTLVITFHIGLRSSSRILIYFYFLFFKFQGAWVLRPKNSKPVAVVHFVGGIFVGAAPQLTYRLFLERLSEK